MAFDAVGSVIELAQKDPSFAEALAANTGKALDEADLKLDEEDRDKLVRFFKPRTLKDLEILAAAAGPVQQKRVWPDF